MNTTIKHRSALALPILWVVVLLLTTACGDGSTEAGSDAAAPSTDARVGETADGSADRGEAHENEGDEGADEVHLTPEQLSALDIEVGTLDSGNAESVLERPATIALDPDRVALVGPRIEAKVERVLRDLGDRVGAGESLAVMSSVGLGEAKAQHLALKARLETARAGYERERRLYADRISSEAEMLEAQAQYRAAEADVDVVHERLRLYGLSTESIEAIEPDAVEPLSFFRLTSPVDGVIQRRDLSPGQTVGPTDTPVHVVSVDSLWVTIEAFARDASLLKPGAPVAVRVRGVSDGSIPGTLDWVSYELDPETRTMHARAVVGNPGGRLRAGMFGTARIELPAEVRYAMAPVDAVQTLEGRTVVFVPGDEKGAFHAIPVRLGRESSDGRVEIVSGLEPGARAVVAGAFDLMSAATAAARSASHGH